MFFCAIVLLIASISGFESSCPKLSISTDITVTRDDVVKAGVVQEKWGRNSINPEIVSSSTMIDYLYVTVEGGAKPLDESSFRLEFDDHFFADSNFNIDSKKNNKKAQQYSVEIKYRCKEYGGALIDYELEVNVPECGKAHIFWKKICGNPLVNRAGLTMDIEYGKYNSTIVKNGVLVDASYFDADLDNFVFQVPSNSNSTKFYLYLEKVENDTDKETGKKEKTESEKIEDEFQILESILKMIPEVEISTPVVDADQTILSPTVTGPLASGGMITQETQPLSIQYNCKEKGETTIELTIPLDYFRDINLIFVKKCFMEDYTGVYYGGRSWFATLVWLGVFAFIGKVIYNVIVLGLQGLNAIPFGNELLMYLKARSGGQAKKFGDEEDEQEFKIERVEQNKQNYGSL